MGTFAAPLLSQTKFADSKNNNKNVDEKIFTGDPTIDTLGGGLIGVGLGALGASILGPTIGQVLGGNNGIAAQGTQGCGKRRKKRQAASPNKGRDEPNTKFFGNLFGGNDQNCGACCYSQGYNQGASNYNNQGQGFNHGSSNQAGRCQCDYSKTFTDQNGRPHGGCRRADESGRTWCYTTGWGNSGCGDLQSSRRFPNNPWSYRACSYNG